MASSRVTVPNVITLARIAACPVVFVLVTAPGLTARFWAFVLFVAAALSDIWDGYLARRHGLVTDFGKLMDPLADKLLLVVTFVPIFLVSHGPDAGDRLPWWGEMPIWVLVVILGRELFITLFRWYAARRGVVIPAGRSGKHKTLLQYLFVGGTLLWYPLLMVAEENAWEGGFWSFWRGLHGGWIGVTLLLALLMTVYSMIDYLWSYRSVVTAER